VLAVPKELMALIQSLALLPQLVGVEEELDLTRTQMLEVLVEVEWVNQVMLVLQELQIKGLQVVLTTT
jgi:hypothetical protein